MNDESIFSEHPDDIALSGDTSGKAPKKRLISKRSLLIIILAAALGAVAGIYYIVDMLTKDRIDILNNVVDSSTGRVVLMYGEPMNLKTCTVVNTYGTYTVQRVSDKVYEVADMDMELVDRSKVTYFTADVTRVICTKVVEENCADLSVYGLDNPQCSYETTFIDGQKFTYYVGDKSPLDDGYYLIEKGGTTVYLVNKDLEKYVLMPPTVFYSEFGIFPEITDEQILQLSELIIYNLSGDKLYMQAMAEEDINQEMLTSTHVMKSPVMRSVSGNSIQNVIKIFSNFKPNYLIAELDEENYEDMMNRHGFDEPRAMVEFTFDGIKKTLLFGSDHKKGYIYMVDVDKPLIFSVALTRMPLITMSVRDFVEAMPYTRFIDSILSVELATADGSWKFDLKDSETENMTVTCGGEPVDSEAFRNYYRNLVSASVEGEFRESVSGEPDLEITVTAKSGDVDVIEFIPIDSRRYLFRLNGSGGFYILKNNVDKLISDVPILLEGGLISSLW